MLMSDSAKRNKISPLSLFYILFICRIVVCLTSVHSISTTEINSGIDKLRDCNGYDGCFFIACCFLL